MKKIRFFSAAVLSVCLFAAVFSSCDKTDKITSDSISSTSKAASGTTESTQGVSYSMGADGHRYYIYNYYETETATESITHTIKPPANIESAKTEAAKSTSKAKKTTKNNETTVKNSIHNETVKDESKGITVLSRTTPVKKGSSASVTIMGTAGKSYSIDFYKDNSSLYQTNGLGQQTADRNGLVTWTFTVGYDCESGNRKIIIKEKGSDNYVQTSITVE